MQASTDLEQQEFGIPIVTPTFNHEGSIIIIKFGKQQLVGLVDHFVGFMKVICRK